ncbi:uncharacterized protein GGS22DRAFT_3696 [Annulohypoxylon maeteangense]|uniref:uncharacterized protein n=1 Tax=Annulohypoxylon maeteangense TaxID=1927788 RepID=UPI002007EAC1|nr:uncharacterized protein GGS22DRAFT_3696 [Annulohypoxylon maeteangense]KAI0889755.1 hypothetical protein GGS22DRAFT_3696 [Annulohypoxylon maeteangense]
MDPGSLDPRLRDPGEDSIVVNGPSNPSQQQQLAVAGLHNSQQSDLPESPLQQQIQSQSTGPSPVASATGFTPHTPNGHHTHSAASDTPNGPGNTPQDPNDPKRPRACEACRGLKVKCEPDPANPDGPCKRCAKAGRNCVVTQPTRKRQKKTDSRVAELEKKIDALTASLHASRGGPSTASHTTPSEEPTYGYGHASTSKDWGAPPSRDHQPQSAPEPEKRSSYAAPTSMAGQKRKFTESNEGSPDVASASPVPPKSSTGPESEPDVIDRGIITMSEAAAFFDRFTEDMVPHLPAVVFPEGTTAIEVRKTKPILFLAIMAAASSEIPKLQRQLVREIMQIFADQIIITGRKSLELIQSLLVSVIWYYPPEHFEELKFYQFVHLAAVMSIDIGLGRKKHNPKTRLVPYTWRDHPFRKQPLPDPMSVEARRTWLAVYFLASNVSMALHRPNLIRWQPFMTECMDILESSPQAAPTDRYLCHLVWTHRLAEDVGIQFSMDDPSVFVNVSEQKVQYALRGFERDLAKYSESIPKAEKRPSLILGFHVLNLYMHEIALHVDKSPEEYRPPCNADSLREPIPGLEDSLTPSHISALSSCLTAIDGIFETFLLMDVRSIRCIPIFSFVRVAYAVVVLIKMYFSASNSNSELGKVINKDNMKVAEYLEKLLEKFREVAASDKSRPASKFLLVLAMLRSWFYKQGQAHGKGLGDDEAASAAIQDLRGGMPTNEQKKGSAPPQQHPQQHHQAQANNSGQTNTPLQLLSEIATGNGPPRSNGQNPAPDSNTHPYQANAGWLRSVPQPAQPFMYDPTGGNVAATSRGGMSGPGPGSEQSFMPWMADSFGSSDFDYTSLGDGFEQAMGLTLTGFGGGSPGDPASYEDTMRYMMQNNMLGPVPVEGFATAPQGPQAGPNGNYYPF